MAGMNNSSRQGHFTSSNAYKLIKLTAKGDFQKIGQTYIQEKQIERRLKSCLDGGGYTQSLAWGNFMELVIYNILGTNYQIASKDTVLHPEHGKFWSGSVDLFTANRKTGVKESVAEIKCYQKKNFALYSDCLMKKDIDVFRADFPKEYWQIVSNAIIHDVEIGEGILYMPYVSEAEEIKDLASNYEGDDKWMYRFIEEKPIEELPFLPDGGYYKNICKFAFIIPQEDKDYLTDRMIQASKILLNTK